MATCKDCIHYEVCGSLGMEVYRWGRKPTLQIFLDKFKAEHCTRFKPSSRFVELPFGTDVITDNVLFLIVDRYGRIGRKKIKIGLIKEVFVDHVTIGSRGVPFITVVDTITNTWFDSITAKDFGKTIFLTREEAEKALKEREA